jgi:signal transduction histidine kinase
MRHPEDVAWVAPLTAFIAVGTFFATGGHDGLTGREWVGVALAGLATVALVAWRRFPRGTVLAVGGLVGLYLAIGCGDGPVYLPTFAAAFLAARAVPLRLSVPATLVAAAAVLSGTAVRAATTELGWWQPLGQSTVLLALTGAAAAIGTTLRSRADERAERSARAATEEQLRMAQDLHDGVGHGLAVIAMQAGVGLHVLERDPAAARAALEAIRETSRDSLASLRAELSRLSGQAPLTPRHGLADLDALAERVGAAGLDVDLVREGSAAISPAVDAAAFAIVQESLTNVLRHAGARHVTVAVSVADTVRIGVTDDGRGGPVTAEGMGLRGMRDRAEALGGTLSAGPADPGGFRVTATLPRGQRDGATP